MDWHLHKYHSLRFAHLSRIKTLYLSWVVIQRNILSILIHVVCYCVSCRPVDRYGCLERVKQALRASESFLCGSRHKICNLPEALGVHRQCCENHVCLLVSWLHVLAKAKYTHFLYDFSSTYQRLIIEQVLFFKRLERYWKKNRYFFRHSFTSFLLVNTLVFSYNRGAPIHWTFS
jgi:hypothetical protein